METSLNDYARLLLIELTSCPSTSYSCYFLMIYWSTMFDWTV